MSTWGDHVLPHHPCPLCGRQLVYRRTRGANVPYDVPRVGQLGLQLHVLTCTARGLLRAVPR